MIPESLLRANRLVVSPVHVSALKAVAEAERGIVSEFPLRLLVALEDEQIQGTIRLGIEECADLTRIRAAWDQNSLQKAPE